jgi:hypothetical protein
VKPDDPLITVRKLGAHLPVSAGQLMDEGLIPDTRPPAPRPPPHRRTAARARAAVAAARIRAGSWVAGVDLDHECED